MTDRRIECEVGILQTEGTRLADRSDASRMRGTPDDAPKIVQLFDEVAVFSPNTDFGRALWLWAEEATRILERMEASR